MKPSKEAIQDALNSLSSDLAAARDDCGDSQVLGQQPEPAPPEFAADTAPPDSQLDDQHEASSSCAPLDSDESGSDDALSTDSSKKSSDGDSDSGIKNKSNAISDKKNELPKAAATSMPTGGATTSNKRKTTFVAHEDDDDLVINMGSSRSGGSSSSGAKKKTGPIFCQTVCVEDVV